MGDFVDSSAVCKHNWAHSYNITKEGILESILECEKCGQRSYRPEGFPPFKLDTDISNNSQGDV